MQHTVVGQLVISPLRAERLSSGIYSHSTDRHLDNRELLPNVSLSSTFSGIPLSLPQHPCPKGARTRFPNGMLSEEIGPQYARRPIQSIQISLHREKCSYWAY